MAKNEFKPFATANGANVTAQSDYETLPARASGFQSGKASSAQINKAIRQATVIASVVAQFIADESENDVMDDGNVAALQQSLLAALKQNAADNLPKASITTAGITKLSSATDSSDETAAATPKAVKAANDNASSRLLATATAAAATKLATARTIGGVSFDGIANINLPGVNAAGNQSTTGNAATATKLATARAINGVAFDGTANITVTAAANGGAADNADKLTTPRTINGVAFDGSTNITITAAANGGTAATTTGNAGTATKLATARTINGVAFDGTANIVVTATANGGAADTAIKLATARTIGGVSFDGTSNINLPGVNAAGNQSTTGNAATATKLATARTIGGVSFDGTANINIPGSRVWVSGDYTPVIHTPLIISHGLAGINPLQCQCDVLLRCVIAEAGYSVGDYAINLGTLYSVANVYTLIWPNRPVLTSSNVQVNTMGTLVCTTKDTSVGNIQLTLANWRYQVRVFY